MLFFSAIAAWLLRHAIMGCKIQGLIYSHLSMYLVCRRRQAWKQGWARGLCSTWQRWRRRQRPCVQGQAQVSNRQPPPQGSCTAKDRRPPSDVISLAGLTIDQSTRCKQACSSTHVLYGLGSTSRPYMQSKSIWRIGCFDKLKGPEALGELRLPQWTTSVRCTNRALLYGQKCQSHGPRYYRIHMICWVT